MLLIFLQFETVFNNLAWVIIECKAKKRPKKELKKRLSDVMKKL
jgi:hypothetical protein